MRKASCWFIRAALRPSIAVLLLAGLVACENSKGSAGPTPVPCSYALSESNQSFSSANGAGAVSILTERECAWTVQGAGGWVTLTSPAGGTGPGTASFAVAANSGPGGRTMVLTVAGLPFTLSQEGRLPCSFAVEPPQAGFEDRGGTGRITVATAAGCAWSASSAAPWIVVTAGGRGQGNGTVEYRVSEHNGEAPRTGTLTVAGRIVTIAQEGEGAAPPPEPLDCEYSVSRTEFLFHWHGAGGDAQLTTGTACTWTASSDAGWLVLRSGAGGAGAGTIRFDVGSYTSEQTRRGAIEVRWPTPTAGQNVRVEQEGCRYGLAAPGAVVAVAGGPGEVFVVSQPVTLSCPLGCPWTAQSRVPWIQITSSPTKSGDDFVRYTVAANATGAERVGTIRIQEMTYTITQAGQ